MSLCHKGIQVRGPVAPISAGGEAEKEWRESAEGKKTKKGRLVDVVGLFPRGADVNSPNESIAVFFTNYGR